MRETRKVADEDSCWGEPGEPVVLRARGACADSIRASDWSETPIGDIHAWDGAFVAALELILGSGFPMFLTWGPDHQFFFNDAYAPVVSDKGDCLGRPFRRIFPEAWPTIEPAFLRAFAGEATYDEDLEVPLARNHRLARTWWSFSYSPARDSFGAVRGVLGVVYETTRRLLAEQSLLTSEAALRAMTDTAPALLWRCDADGRLAWMNRRLERYLGAEALGDSRFQDRFHADDREAAEAAHARAVARNGPFEGQFRLRDLHGGHRWFFIRAQQVWDGEGVLIGWSGSAVDIQDWRAAADRAEASENLIREVSAAESTLMWTADLAERRISGLNPDFRSAWALPFGDGAVDWDEWLAVIHPEDRPPVLGAVERVAVGETLQGKFRVETGAGLRWFHATAFPITGEDGAVRRIGGLLVDVTRDIDPRVYVIEADPSAQNRLLHAFTRAGFKTRSFEDACALARVSDDLMPGVVVLASDKPYDDVAHAASILRMGGRRLPWVVAAALDDRLDAVVRLMKLGAADVLDRNAPLDQLVSAVRAAMPVREVQSEGAPEARRKIAELSRREREVLDGLLAGGTNKSIALDLSLSPRTVETYRAQLMDRLGARSLADLLNLAREALQ